MLFPRSSRFGPSRNSSRKQRLLLLVDCRPRLTAFFRFYLKSLRQPNPSFFAFPFKKHQEVGVILPSMGLPQQSADPRLALADDNEQILGNEPMRCQLVNDFHVCQSLLIGAYLVLAFDNVNPASAQDSPSLTRCRKIQIQYCFMVFLVRVGLVVFIVAFVVLVIDVSRAARCVHVGGGQIQHNR